MTVFLLDWSQALCLILKEPGIQDHGYINYLMLLIRLITAIRGEEWGMVGDIRKRGNGSVGLWVKRGGGAPFCVFIC